MSTDPAGAEAADTRLASPGAFARRRWLGATIALTLVPFVLAFALAPTATARPGPALTWLLFVGASVHVGATGWFYTVPEVRSHMARHRGRYLATPVLLVIALASVAPMVWARTTDLLLVGFFGWQFFHFQKQNLGLAALAGRASGVAAMTSTERRALLLAGIGGITGLAGHPALLQLDPFAAVDGLFLAGLAVFASGVVLGAVCLLRRPRRERQPGFAIVYVTSLLFFAPVFVVASPYAAVAGLTIAHGLQYLLLVGLLAAVPVDGRHIVLRVLVFANVALLLGISLNTASHLHNGGTAARVVFGAYLGLVCAHFVVDAGLWRLRDEFPRAFLRARLPYLLS